MPDEILLIFTHKQKPIADAYLEAVAYGGLHKYRALSQHGIREGQDLYSHLVCGGLRLHTLSSLFDFSELETRLLMAAFSIHDLNKLYEPGGKGLRQVADDRVFLEQVIQESGVSHFFPEWETYVVDLKQLILGHGAHSTVAGEQLFARIPGSRIDKERLRELTHLMRATDIADLSKTFESTRSGTTVPLPPTVAKAISQQYVPGLILEENSLKPWMWRNLIHDGIYPCDLVVTFDQHGSSSLLEKTFRLFTGLDGYRIIARFGWSIERQTGEWWVV